MTVLFSVNLERFPVYDHTMEHQLIYVKGASGLLQDVY